ncbi:PAS domain S-box protein [Robertmurraya korlensis]|uniref:HD domain-containing phosphohydrolase n=1 Tax=Robertmurraya korlensis TaxID=519977 RepID=UPI0020417429|nr:HD domain-containing phosphohydrolase [Robertmurraya korlensis]MCM3601955.1 PAS domain S-box protein [Robertmurraya korlensis]
MTVLALPDHLTCFLKLGDAVIITDREHTIIAVNKEFETITGYSMEQTVGKKAGFFKSKFTTQSTYESMKKALSEEKHWSGILDNRKQTGELWHSSITITPIRIGQYLYYVGVFRELESLKKGVYFPDKKLFEVKRELLRVLAVSCEIRDPGIEEHLLRVQDLTELLLRTHCQRNDLSLDTSFINNVIHSSIMHDIGKAGIPEGILYKPGPLTSYERRIIELHPLMGKDIFNKITTSASHEFMSNLAIAENIILFHHEKWDGTGYPYRLKGDDIPFEARIVAIVDVYDALTSRRPYKDSWSEEQALVYIKEMRGKHFDPDLTDTFLKLF